MSWEKVRFGDVLEIKNGKDHKKVNNPKGKYPIYGSGGIMGYADDYLCEENSTVIGRKGSINNPIFVDTKFWNVDTAFSLTPSNKLHSKYLFYFCSNYNFEKHNKATTLPSLTKSDLLDIQIPLPSFSIQKQIAEILDAAAELKRREQELMSKYDELAQSIFIDMFGDPIKNEKAWEMKTIGQLIKNSKYSIKRGPFGGALKKEIFVKDGFLVYEQFHALNNDFSFGRYYIDKEKYKELIAFKVEPGDIIISCSGIYLGKLAIVPNNAKEGIINQALLKITLDQSIYLNEFFIKVFSQENFKETYFASERGAAIPNFPPMSTFKEFKFIAPPIELQNQYLLIVENLRQQINCINNQIIHSNDLFNSLILRAYKGELVS
jgi:type I restriction enzyme S subunit